jgi:hypothetical protein
MSDQDDRRRSGLKIPILIAAVAVITAVGAIVVALRSSPSEPTSAPETLASRPATAQPVTPPAGAPAPTVSDQQHQVSKALARPLRAAQDALKLRNFQDAIAILEAADSTQEKSPYDQHLINVFLSTAYAGVKNYGAAARFAEAELNDGFLTAAEIEKETIAAALLNYQIKNYDRTIELGSRAIRSGSANPQLPTIVAQAYYLKGDWGDAARFEDDFVNRQIAAGAIPGRLPLELWMSSCLKLHDDSCERRALDQLVAYYPAPETQRELERLRAAR